MIYLERHSDDDNIHRFYAMEVNCDLFGTWVLDRTWGRVGGRGGQKLLESFKTEVDAAQMQAKLGEQKLRRGYVPVGDPPLVLQN